MVNLRRMINITTEEVTPVTMEEVTKPQFIMVTREERPIRMGSRLFESSVNSVFRKERYP